MRIWTEPEIVELEVVSTADPEASKDYEVTKGVGIDESVPLLPGIDYTDYSTS